MEWLKQNWFKFGILLVIAIGIASFLNIYRNAAISAGQSHATSPETEVDTIDPVSASGSETPQPVSRPPARERTPNEVSAEFKILTEDYMEEGASLLSIIDKNTDIVCASILENRASGGHAYYYYMDAYKRFSAEYADERMWVEYIDKSLNSMIGALNYVRDKCAARQYYIPSI